MKKKKTIFFYSSVKTKKMFAVQKFYRTDILILKELGYNVCLSNSIFDFLSFWKYDIAFIYFYRYGAFPAILAKLFGKKVIFTGGIDFLDRNYANIKKYIIQKFFFKLCILFSDKIILVSNADIKNIKVFKTKLDHKKFYLSFHVIDYDKFEFNDVSMKEKILTTIAWMVNVENAKRKGVDESILFFKEIYKLDKEFKMYIIGPLGKGSVFIDKIIKDNGLKSAIVLTGSISEIEKINILQKSLIYSQLSVYEGFGIAAVEALAAGNIVVHTGVGGLNDGLGNNGILTNKNDYKEVCNEVFSLISEPKKHLLNIDKGLNYVSDNFRYEKRLLDFREIFNSL